MEGEKEEGRREGGRKGEENGGREGGRGVYSRVYYLLSLLFFSRWASKGLNFLTTALPPRQLATITDQHFEDLKKLMTDTLNHVIGEARPMQRRGKSRVAKNASPIVH